jgi:hypothetical protein
MRKTTKALTVAVGLSLWSLLPLDGSVYALTSNYTFNFQGGVMPAGSNVIRLFAKAALGSVETTYTGHFVFAQGGATEQQVRDLVFADMQAQNWVVIKTSSNGILIAGRHMPQGFMPTRELGGGDTHEDITVTYTANVDIDEVASTQPRWGIVIATLSADATNPGTVAVTLNGIEVLAELAGGDAGEQVIVKLANAMTAKGFQVIPVVTRFGGHVLLDWRNPINFAKLGGTVEAVLELRNAAGGPNFLLTLPKVTPSAPPPPPPPPGRP